MKGNLKIVLPANKQSEQYSASGNSPFAGHFASPSNKLYKHFITKVILTARLIISHDKWVISISHES